MAANDEDENGSLEEWLKDVRARHKNQLMNLEVRTQECSLGDQRGYVLIEGTLTILVVLGTSASYFSCWTQQSVSTKPKSGR